MTRKMWRIENVKMKKKEANMKKTKERKEEKT
jgi:hypothetical protein